MEKIQYNTIKKINEIKTSKIKIGDKEIEVLSYLPINEKNDLVNLVLQNSRDYDGTFSPIKIDMYCHLYMVYAYSNLEFTDEDRADEALLYDELENSGTLSAIIDEIPESEYESIINYINDYCIAKQKREGTLAGILDTIVNKLPVEVDKAQEIISSFDKEQFQNVINFAKAANGGQSIQ